MKFKSWWDWARHENEKTYGKWCEHRDLAVMSRDYPDNPTGKHDVTCRTCGAKAEWNRKKSYDHNLPKTLNPNYKGVTNEPE